MFEIAPNGHAACTVFVAGIVTRATRSTRRCARGRGRASIDRLRRPSVRAETSPQPADRRASGRSARAAWCGADSVRARARAHGRARARRAYPAATASSNRSNRRRRTTPRGAVRCSRTTDGSSAPEARPRTSQSAYAPCFTETGWIGEWLASDLEVDRDDVRAERDAELRDGNVLIVVLVRVERRAIRKRNRQSGVVRARRSHDV